MQPPMGERRCRETLPQNKLHHNRRFAIFIIFGRAPYRLEPLLLIDRYHRRIAFAAVRHHPPESISPSVLDFPLLNPLSQPTSPIRTQQPRTLNIDRTPLRRVFPVPSQVLLKLHVTNKRSASSHSPVNHNPVRFQAQPILWRESILPEYLNVQPP